MRKIGFLFIPFLCFALISCSAKATKKTETPGDLYVQAVNLLQKKKYSDAIEKFMKIREEFPFDPITVVAQVKLGDAYFEKKEYLSAAGAYEDFFNAHPEDENIPYVLKQLGESYARLSPTVDRDQAYTVKAIERFTYLKNRYPQSTYARDAQMKIDELTEKQAAHDLYVGEFYHRTERYNASILRLEYFLNKYPKAKNRDRVLFLLADSYDKLSDSDKSTLYREQLNKEFPQSPHITSTRAQAVAVGKPRIQAAAGPKIEKISNQQTEHRTGIILLDTGNPQPKEIDLRPPVTTRDRTEPVAAQIAPEPKAGKDGQEPGSPQESSGNQSGLQGSTPAKAARASERVESAKGDQKKGPLGFFSAEKKPIDVVSDRMEGLEKGKVIIFKGNVIAKQGDLEMFSDTLTAYLSEETNEIESALAKGHVKIVKEDRIATCEEALFENSKGEITLKGNVVVFSGPNKVAGDTVKYFINEDRVSVESDKGKKAHITVHPKQ